MNTVLCPDNDGPVQAMLKHPVLQNTQYYRTPSITEHPVLQNPSITEYPVLQNPQYYRTPSITNF